MNSFQVYKKNPQIIFIIGLQFLIFILTSGIRLFIAFKALGLEISPLKIILIQSLASFAIIFSITPSDIGIKEGIIAFMASFLDIPHEQAFLAAGLDRVISASLTFVLGIAYSKILLKGYTKKEV